MPTIVRKTFREEAPLLYVISPEDHRDNLCS
jgi:hypothetical protein